jgi:hypothetical protein
MSRLVAVLLAGNLDSFALGNEAALTGGAVIASTHDAAATWYNPAGLGALERDSIDGSASAITYRVYVLPDAIRVQVPPDTRAADASSSALLTVPAALVTARHFGDRLAVGVGIFVQRQEFFSGRAALGLAGATPEGPYRYDVAFGVVQQLATYYAGGALGVAVTPELRAGVGIFGVYSTLTSVFDFGSNLAVNGQERATGVLERRASFDVFGVRPTLGLQWTPGAGASTPTWHLGATLRAPTVAFHASQQISGTDATTTIPGGGAAPQASLSLPNSDLTPSSVQVIEPTRVHVGFARELGRGWIGMSADYQFPLHNPDGTLATTEVVNAQVGGRFWALDWLSVGMGLFTDRSPVPGAFTRTAEADRIDHIGSTRVHFFGATGGIEYRHRYVVHKEGEATVEHHRGLEFSTTLAVRYARGRGTIQGSAVEPLTSSPSDYRPIATDATIHELNLHIGSALYF